MPVLLPFRRQSMQNEKYLESTNICQANVFCGQQSHVHDTQKKKKRSDREGFQMLHLEKRIKVNAAKNNHNWSNILDNFN